MMETVDDIRNALEEKGVEATLRSCRRPPLPTRLLRDLYDDFVRLQTDATSEQDLQALLFVSSYPLIPSDLAERICFEQADSQPHAAAALAANPRTPPTALTRLCRAHAVAVRMAAAAHPNLSSRDFHCLATDEAAIVRLQLAAHPTLPITWQLIMASDADASVRAAIAQRKQLDADIAIFLADDSDPWVRACCIANTTVSDEIRQMLADSDDLASQQILLSSDMDLPDSVMASLRLSPHFEVRHEAFQKSAPDNAEMIWLADSDDVRDRLFLAAVNALPYEIQMLLAEDPAAKVRRRLALHATIDERVAECIAMSKDSVASAALATNPTLPSAILDLLCQHPENSVAETVAVRSDLRTSHLYALSQRQDPSAAELLAARKVVLPGISADIALRWVGSAAASLRTFAAHCTQLPANTFALLAADPAPAVRRAVADNSACPRPILYQLAADPIREIAFAAEKTLSKTL